MKSVLEYIHTTDQLDKEVRQIFDSFFESSIVSVLLEILRLQDNLFMILLSLFFCNKIILLMNNDRQSQNSITKNIVIFGKTSQEKTNFIKMLTEQWKYLKRNQINVPYEMPENIDYQIESYNIEIQDYIITLNIINVQAIFEDSKYMKYRISCFIDNLKLLERLINMKLQGELHRVFLILDAKIENHEQKLLISCSKLVYYPEKICVVLIQCQKLYLPTQTEQEIINTLNQFKRNQHEYIEELGIEDIILIGNQSYSKKENQQDQIYMYYQNQWKNLYEIIRKSQKMKILDQSKFVQAKDVFKDLIIPQQQTNSKGCNIF